MILYHINVVQISHLKVSELQKEKNGNIAEYPFYEQAAFDAHQMYLYIA